MTTISAQIIADSTAYFRPRLTTFLLRYPRWIHSEMMAHRAFSRNASSSRAVPVKKLIQSVIDDPAVPMFWGADQKGMQSKKEHNATILVKKPEIEYSSSDEHEAPTPVVCWGYRDLKRETAWLHACDNAIETAKAFAESGYHKQLVNRLLEPFSHITVVVTATEWSNFFAVRRHPDAEPHIKLLADRMWEIMQTSTPSVLTNGDWHLPFVTNEDRKEQSVRWRVNYYASDKNETEANLLKLSVARCASTSYKTVDGFHMTMERAVALHDKLVGSTPIHASPCEHQACVDDYHTNGSFMNPHQSGNFSPGWIQYRKTLAEESL